MRSTTILFFAVGALGLLSVAHSAQDSVLIRRKLVEGQKLTYSTTTTSRQSVKMAKGAGNQEVGMKMFGTYRYITGKVDAKKGNAKLKVTCSIDKTVAEGPMAEFMKNNAKPKVYEYVGTINQLGEMVLSPTNPDKAMQMMMSSDQSMTSSPYSAGLPVKAVKRGDTWETPVPKSPFTGSKKQNLLSKLVGEKVINGVPAFEVSTVGTINIDIDMGKLMAEGPMAGQKMLMKGTMQLTMTSYIAKATGISLSATQVVKSKQTVDMVSMGMKMAMTGTTTTEFKLK